MAIDTTLDLEENDLLVLYIDGITEAHNAEIVACTRAWMTEQDDDISMLVVRRRS